MVLVRFKTNVTLGFIQSDGDLLREDFSIGDIAEFDLLPDAMHDCCTLKRAQGDYAPWVQTSIFHVLDGFRVYQCTKTVDLSFASGGPRNWDWEESKQFNKGCLYAFKLVSTESIYSDLGYANVVTPEGRMMPGVPRTLFMEVRGTKFTFPLKNRCEPAPRITKQILEAFPAPVPGDKGFSMHTWSCPYTFNSLPVVRDNDVPSSLLDCVEEPVAYLSLAQGDGRYYDKLYYRCSFFGVPKAKSKTIIEASSIDEEAETWIR